MTPSFINAAVAAKRRAARDKTPRTNIVPSLVEAGVSIVAGAAAAAPGTVSTGTVLRGSAIADTSMVLYASGSIASKAYLYNAAALTSGGATTYSGQSVTYLQSPSVRLNGAARVDSSLELGVLTTSTLIGVLAYTPTPSRLEVAEAATTIVQVMAVDPATGAQTVFNTVPEVAFNTAPHIIYFQLPAGTKRLHISVSGYLGGLVLPAGSDATPWDFTVTSPTMAVATDSFGTRPFAFTDSLGRDGLPQAIARQMGALGLTQIAWSGGGYTTFAGGPGANGIIETDRLKCLVSPKPDITLFAMGINDAFAGSAANTAAIDAYVAKIKASWNFVRTQNPGSTLIVVGGWAIGTDSATLGYAYFGKAEAMRDALRQYAAPWVFVDNYRNQWEASSGLGGTIPIGSRPWITGQSGTNALKSRPNGASGNLYEFLSDGTHPAAWYSFNTSAASASGASSLTLAPRPSRISSADGSRSVWNLIPSSGYVSVQDAASPVSYAAGKYYAYTLAGAASPNVMNVSPPLSAAVASGARVLPFATDTGLDYYARQIAYGALLGLRSLGGAAALPAVLPAAPALG